MQQILNTLGLNTVIIRPVSKRPTGKIARQGAMRLSCMPESKRFNYNPVIARYKDDNNIFFMLLFKITFFYDSLSPARVDMIDSVLKRAGS